MEEGAWQRGQRNSITLRKGEGMNVVLLVMKAGKAGDRLEEHTAPGLQPERPCEGASALWWRRRWPRRDPILCSPATRVYGAGGALSDAVSLTITG